MNTLQPTHSHLFLPSEPQASDCFTFHNDFLPPELQEYLSSPDCNNHTAHLEESDMAEFDAQLRSEQSIKSEQSVRISDQMYVFKNEEMFVVMSCAFIDGLGYVLNAMRGDWQGISGADLYIFRQNDIQNSESFFCK